MGFYSIRDENGDYTTDCMKAYIEAPQHQQQHKRKRKQKEWFHSYEFAGFNSTINILDE